MKVLVACEYSGAVRDAFIRRGHDAISCDLLPTDVPGPHYQGDVRDIIEDGFDLMVAHPPCTYLSLSGVRWLWNADGSKNEDRWAKMEDGAKFFRYLLDAPVPRIAVENPIMHGYAKAIVGRGPDQTIQPYEHGHEASKRTGLWLVNLPKIVPTNIVGKGEFDVTKSGRRIPRWYNLPPDRKNGTTEVPRWKVRSATFSGIADAFAEQWGDPRREKQTEIFKGK